MCLQIACARVVLVLLHVLIVNDDRALIYYDLLTEINILLLLVRLVVSSGSLAGSCWSVVRLHH